MKRLTKSSLLKPLLVGVLPLNEWDNSIDIRLAAGAQPVKACTYAFPATDVKTFLSLGNVLEGEKAI